MWHAAMWQLQLMLLLFCLGNMPPHAVARHSRIELTTDSATLEAVASDNLAELQQAEGMQPVPATAPAPAPAASDETKSTDSHSNPNLSHKATDPSLKNDQSLYLTLANTNANVAAVGGATKTKLVDGKYEK